MGLSTKKGTWRKCGVGSVAIVTCERCRDGDGDGDNDGDGDGARRLHVLGWKGLSPLGAA